MKFDSHMLLKWAVFVVVLSLPWVDSAGQREERGPRGSLRRRRSACQDGNYTVGGKTCCRCAAGQRLSQPCGDTPEDRVCEYCDPGKTYSSVPNAETTCELCTSCTQRSANLEVKEECTIAKNAVCQCKGDHYCSSTPCTTCNPCDKCEGRAVKSPCTGTTNTVCGEKVLGPGPIISIVVCLIVLIGAIVAIVVCWKKKRLCFSTSSEVVLKSIEDADAKTSQEMLPLLDDLDLTPHVPEIAKVLGWKVMRDVALKSGFTQVSIDNHTHNHPGDANEQTLQLLLEWVQKKGKKAARELVERLGDEGHADQWDRVRSILQPSH